MSKSRKFFSFFIFWVFFPVSWSVKTKVLKVIAPGGKEVRANLFYPIPKNFPLLPQDFLTSSDNSWLSSLSRALPKEINDQLVEEISLSANKQKAPKPFVTREMKAQSDRVEVVQQLIERGQFPGPIDMNPQLFDNRTQLELRHLRRKTKSLEESIPEVIHELLYYVYCDRKVTIMQLLQLDSVLFQSLKNWSFKNQANLWPAIRLVSEVR